MKNLKKNNKGFSLVELIVVVLIIAIIAVALAPQVIKWVNEARNNTEKNQKATIKSALDTVVSDCIAAGKDIPTSVTIDATGATVTVTGSGNKVGGSAAGTYTGTGNFDEKAAIALSDLKDGKTYTVTIDSNYTVKVN